MSEQPMTPPQQPPAGVPTTPSGVPLPPFTPPPASHFPAGGPTMIDPARMSNKSIALRKLAGGAIGIVLLIVVGTIWSVMTGDPSIASTGDCLIGQSSEDIKVVDCDDASAEWTVLDEVEDVRDDDFDAAGENYTGCAAHPTVEAWFWSGEGHNGDVLCLEPIKK
ncbi:hypothetical protein AB0J74_33340 [Asanoa sp. NPDC049573]|uniref:LppU/SCO3897 family protein n=1 Tax=Asanoa sp. NPDC049573 TaxID=3155396 RepID=UPI00343D5975